MDVILTISFKITAEIEIRKHVLRRTSQRSSQTRCIGFVKHTMYVLSFIHCHEMRLHFFCFFLLTVNSSIVARSSLHTLSVLVVYWLGKVATSRRCRVRTLLRTFLFSFVLPFFSLLFCFVFFVLLIFVVVFL